MSPDPAEGAYSAPPDSLAGFQGPTSKGRGRDERGREGEGKVGKGKGGKRVGETEEGRDGEGGGSDALQAKAWPPRTIFLAPALGSAETLIR